MWRHQSSPLGRVTDTLWDFDLTNPDRAPPTCRNKGRCAITANCAGVRIAIDQDSAKYARPFRHTSLRREIDEWDISGFATDLVKELNLAIVSFSICIGDAGSMS